MRHTGSVLTIKKTDMFQQWIKKFQLTSTGGQQTDKHWIERLSALLLVEIARSDSTIDEVEHAAIQQALQTSCLSINSEQIENIISTAKLDAETSISLHEQVRQINDGFSREQKPSLIEQLWRVALADGDLDKYEEHMIRKLCGLLYVDHQGFIQAKLKVIDG